jgi:hypothetical protein
MTDQERIVYLTAALKNLGYLLTDTLRKVHG